MLHFYENDYTDDFRDFKRLFWAYLFTFFMEGLTIYGSKLKLHLPEQSSFFDLLLNGVLIIHFSLYFLLLRNTSIALKKYIKADPYWICKLLLLPIYIWKIQPMVNSLYENKFGTD